MYRKNKVIWGASGLSHDASITIVQNNTVLFASSTERYSRIKNDKTFNSNIIQDCLSYGYPDEVVWYENPYKKFLRKTFIDQKFYNPFIKPIKVDVKMSISDHHLSHLCSSLYTAPFNINNSLGIVVDTVGELLSLTIWDIKNYKNKRIIYKHYYPNSLGLFYSSVTKLLGLKPQEDEYIVMGMAAYGESNKYYKLFKNKFFHGRSLKVDLRRGCQGFLTESEISNNKFEIAFGAQKLFEEILLDIIKQFLSKTKYSKIIMSGGCALNCSCNTKISELVDDMWIFPNPGDSGAALGAILSKTKEPVHYENMYLGHDAGTNINVQDVMDSLKHNKIVGVINGRAEFGPRALGNRSILADPRVTNIKDIVNDVKGREKFRPFAPAILESEFKNYFISKSTSSPYMQYTFKCKHADQLPGIVHVDNTSRVQTVNEKTPFMHNVLKEWYKQTGCPILLNTSLNIKGKPLLNSKSDISEFSNTKLNILS